MNNTNNHSDIILNARKLAESAHRQIRKVTFGQIFATIEEFIFDTKSVLYGGMAMRLWAKHLQIDNKYQSLFGNSDYDVYCPDAFKMAQAMLKKLRANNISRFAVKPATHYGTYKLIMYVERRRNGILAEESVNLIDLTEMEPSLMNLVRKDAHKLKAEHIDKHLLVCGPDWLRMHMYSELMKPRDNPSRWPKIAERLAIINTYFPNTMEHLNVPTTVEHINVPTAMDNKKTNLCQSEMQIYENKKRTSSDSELLASALKVCAQFISNRKLILIGFTALSYFVNASKNYKRYRKDMYPLHLTGNSSVSDYDCYTSQYEYHTKELIDLLKLKFSENEITLKKFPEIQGILPKHSEIFIKIGEQSESLVALYEDTECVGYLDSFIYLSSDVKAAKKIPKAKKKSKETMPIRIASLPTLLHLWFAWLIAQNLISENSLHKNDKHITRNDVTNDVTNVTNIPTYAIVSKQKIICAIEFMLNNEQMIHGEPMSIYAGPKCGTNN